MDGAATLLQSMRGMHTALGMHLLHSQGCGWCHLGLGVSPFVLCAAGVCWWLDKGNGIGSVSAGRMPERSSGVL